MKCVKCNREYPDERPVCPYCHTPNENIDMETYNQVQNNQIDQNRLEKRLDFNSTMVQSNILSTNDKYINAFIGDNVESYRKGGLSFAYFFFGEYYLLYRKMYLLFAAKYLATIILIINMIISVLKTSNQGIIGCLIGIAIVQLGPVFFVKKYYMCHVKNSVKKIVENNKDKSEGDIVKICMQRGGTDLLIPAAIVVLTSMISMRAENMALMKTYDTHVRDLSVKSTVYLNLLEANYENFSVANKDECFVTATTELNDNDLEPFIEKNVYGVSNSSNKEINNHTWKYYNKNNTDYYFTTYKDYNYMISTKNVKNNKNCKKSIDIFINSMKFE